MAAEVSKGEISIERRESLRKGRGSHRGNERSGNGDGEESYKWKERRLRASVGEERLKVTN